MTITVNGIPVDPSRWPSPQLGVVRELLRQRAAAAGLLPSGVDDNDLVDSAIERLLAQEVPTPIPAEAELRRYYEAHPDEFRAGDLVHARHILFQVTPQVPVQAIRARAEETLTEVLREPGRFAALARELSNCPSGQFDGNLGQIARSDTVPEFEEALFRSSGRAEILRELVKTRYGFHIVAIDRRIPGETLPFDMVRGQIAQRLEAAVEKRALQQYVSILSGEAEITGVDLERATSPLVQ
ncbi:MAG: peptidyl-prolyl cis-trans isomerase [Beijerinckiaceae bacterium]|nr:peptidyl-prolyl cis-trans isomerase [Beijerinckiaceae bacterium]MCI0735217.1 peptidyl-prolyl cis-trans isomerase [Beijerinckiaceae bacterium]